MTDRFVLFDLGGVAARFDPNRRLPALASLAEVPEDRVYEVVWSSGLSTAFGAAGLVPAD